jgi:hypothetical protein
MRAIIPNRKRNVITIANGIQSGERTHSQDQPTYPVSLSQMNRIVNIPQKPMPPEEEDDLEDAMVVISCECFFQ